MKIDRLIPRHQWTTIPAVFYIFYHWTKFLDYTKMTLAFSRIKYMKGLDM